MLGRLEDGLLCAQGLATPGHRALRRRALANGDLSVGDAGALIGSIHTAALMVVVLVILLDGPREALPPVAPDTALMPRRRFHPLAVQIWGELMAREATARDVTALHANLRLRQGNPRPYVRRVLSLSPFVDRSCLPKSWR